MLPESRELLSQDLRIAQKYPNQHEMLREAEIQMGDEVTSPEVQKLYQAAYQSLLKALETEKLDEFNKNYNLLSNALAKKDPEQL